MLDPVIALSVLLAGSPAGQTSLPRRADTPGENAPTQEEGLPSDPLFDKPLTAQDDQAFVLAMVENLRQGLLDARAGASGLSTPALRAAAARIARQQEATLESLERVARQRGWRLPQSNPERSGTVQMETAVRTSANFIVHQIAQHQMMLRQFRAQIDGRGDAELRRALDESLPGYRRNLETLLSLQL